MILIDFPAPLKLHTVPLKDSLGIKSSAAKEMQGTFGTQQVGSNGSAFIIRKQLQIIAMGTDPKLLEDIATETSRDKQANADGYRGSDGGQTLARPQGFAEKRAFDVAEGNDLGEAGPRKMGHHSAPHPLPHCALYLKLSESKICSFAINTIKRN